MALSLCKLVVLQCIIAPLLAYQLSEPPTDMVIGESVYVLSSGSLTQLHHNLSLVRNISLLEEFNDDATRLVLQEDEQQLLVCFAYGECFLFEMEEFYSPESDFIPEFHPSEGIAVSASEYNSFYIASEELGSVLEIQHYFVSYPDACLVRSTQLWITNEDFISRKFISAFRFDQYVYFVGQDNVFGSETDTLTLMRLCKSENEDLSCSQYTEERNDVYEVVLSCGMTQWTQISGVFVFNETATLVIGLSDSGYYRHCGFNLSVINAELDGTFDSCVAGNGRIPLPWATSDQYTCSDFIKSQVSRCNFGSRNDGGDTIPALASSSPAVGDISVELQNHTINTSLQINIDGTKIMYLAGYTSISNYLMKYHYDERDGMVLLKEYVLKDPPLVMKQAGDFLYLATTTEVTRFRVADCSQHTTCASCTSSSDPLCGWCVLENQCAQLTECGYSELPGHWVQSLEQCVINVILEDRFASVDDVLSVAFDTIPNTSVFPSLSESESFVCMFMDIESNATYNWTMVGSRCVNDQSSISLVNTSHLGKVLSFKIIRNQQIFYNSNSLLTVFNCSQYRRCILCQYAPPCGWCVYENKCTANREQCLQGGDWKSQSTDPQPAHTCPAVFKPDSGRYLQPVGVDRTLNLSTQYIPPPIDGYRYVCRVKYLGRDVAVFDVDAVYSNDSDQQISCQFEKGQIIFLSRLLSGVIGARLSVLYVDPNGEREQEIDFIRDNSSASYQFDSVDSPPPPQPPPSEASPDVLLYNCSQLSSSCSSCVSLRLRPEPFACGWCSRTGAGYNDCTVAEDCHDDINIFFNTETSGRFCPTPFLSSVQPRSGPIQGGTVIQITGTNLGVQESSVESVMLGSYPCVFIDNEYEPGVTIKCRTTAATNTEDVDLIVKINRAGSVEIATLVLTYSYVNPEISVVEPRYGPLSGGTVVSIKGSSLNTSNAEATIVRLAGQHCAIISITLLEIKCISSPHKVSGGIVQMSIDNANIVDGGYSYLSDPVVLSVSPTTTIESGGITVTFTGESLNSTQAPRLVIYDERGIHESRCEADGEAILRCIAPRVQPLLGVNKRSREGALQRVLNYTLIMDNAPGPNISSPGLTLIVKPDPVFTEIEEADRPYITGSGEYIAILGRDVSNVVPSEVIVTVGDLYCDDIVLSSNVLRCRPPLSIGDSSKRISAEVKVVVGDSSLEYSVGALEYFPDSTPLLATAELIAIVLGSSLALLIAFILVCVLALSCLFARKRHHVRRANQELVNGQNGKHEDDLADYSHENVYEDINDLVFSSNGKEWNLSAVKVMDDNVRYQGSIQRNARTLPEIPCEDYIEMGAHSVRADDEELHNGIYTTLMNGKAHANGLTTGEYVDMLPSTNEKSCPTSSSHNEAVGQSEHILSAACSEEIKIRDDAFASGTI